MDADEAIMGAVSPKRTPKKRESQRRDKNDSESEDNLNFHNLGQEIMRDVRTGPKSCRMGDIYHKIKQEVDRISKNEISKLAPTKVPKLKNKLAAVRGLRRTGQMTISED